MEKDRCCWEKKRKQELKSNKTSSLIFTLSPPSNKMVGSMMKSGLKEKKIKIGDNIAF